MAPSTTKGPARFQRIIGRGMQILSEKGYNTSLQSQCKGVRHSPQSPHFVDLILLRVLQGWLSACVWNNWIPVTPSPTVFVQSQGQWLKEKFGEKTSKCLFLYTGVFVTFGKSGAWRSHFDPILYYRFVKTTTPSQKPKFLSAVFGSGSVNEKNAEQYAVLPDVDGFVVGRAGLDVEKLTSICRTLVSCKSKWVSEWRFAAFKKGTWILGHEFYRWHMPPSH